MTRRVAAHFGMRWTTLVALCVCASVVVTAYPSSAQYSGSRIVRDATDKDAVDGLRQIAKCYYSRNAADARTLMTLLPGTPAESALVDRDSVALSPCLQGGTVVFGGLKFKARDLRKLLGGEMARRLLSRIPDPAEPAHDARAWFYSDLAKLPKDALIDRGILAAQEFGHCVAVARWSDSLALIRSEHGSPEEKTAVDRLIPVLNGCLGTGNHIKITRQTLRDLIGEPVYHLVLASTVVGENH